jgi:single-stranded DNA-binding protein
MYLKNEVIIDGKVQKDVKYFSDVINFNLSIITGKYLTPDNVTKKRYTFIKTIYKGEINDKIKDIIKTGNFIRVQGKLDSEQYQSQTGKIVYNKILVIDNVTLLNYDPQFGILTEVM